MANFYKCLICGEICTEGRRTCSARCREIASNLSNAQLKDIIQEWDEKNGS